MLGVETGIAVAGLVFHQYAVLIVLDQAMSEFTGVAFVAFAGPDDQKQVAGALLDLLPARVGGFQHPLGAAELADDDILKFEPVRADRIHEKHQVAVLVFVELAGFYLLEFMLVLFAVDDQLRIALNLWIQPQAGIHAERKNRQQYDRHRLVEIAVADTTGIHDHDFMVLVHPPEGEHDTQKHAHRQQHVENVGRVAEQHRP